MFIATGLGDRVQEKKGNDTKRDGKPPAYACCTHCLLIRRHGVFPVFHPVGERSPPSSILPPMGRNAGRRVHEAVQPLCEENRTLSESGQVEIADPPGYCRRVSL